MQLIQFQKFITCQKRLWMAVYAYDEDERCKEYTYEYLYSCKPALLKDAKVLYKELPGS